MTTKGVSVTPTRSDDELRTFARLHIKYEIEMALGYVDLHPKVSSHPLLNNAVLEAAIVHFRLLNDFFGKSPEQVRKDDAIAQQYAPAWGSRPYLVDDESQRMNGEVAHLTYRRNPHEASSTKGWDLQHLSECLGAICFDFLRVLPPDRRNWFNFLDQIMS